MPEPSHPETQRLEQRFAQRLGELRTILAAADPARLAQVTGARIERLDDQRGLLHLTLWGHPIYVTFPDYIVYEGGASAVNHPVSGEPGAEAADEQPAAGPATRGPGATQGITDGSGPADTTGIPSQPSSAEAASNQANPLDQALLMYYLTTADGAPLTGNWISFSELQDGRFYIQAFQGYTGQELARAFEDDRFAFEQAAQALGGTPFPLGDAAYAFQALPKTPLLAVYWQGDEDFPASCQVLFDSAANHYLPTDAYAILGSTLTRRLIRHKPKT